MVDEITVRGFSFPGRSNGRKRSGGNDSAGAQRGAAKKAARFFPWIGAGNVGTGGRSCGAFKAPRRAFVRGEVSDKPEPEHISRDRRNNRQRVSVLPPERRANRSGGNDSTGAQRGAAKKAARFFPWIGAGNVGIGGRSCGAY